MWTDFNLVIVNNFRVHFESEKAVKNLNSNGPKNKYMSIQCLTVEMLTSREANRDISSFFSQKTKILDLKLHFYMKYIN